MERSERDDADIRAVHNDLNTLVETINNTEKIEPHAATCIFSILKGMEPTRRDAVLDVINERFGREKMKA